MNPHAGQAFWGAQRSTGTYDIVSSSVSSPVWLQCLATRMACEVCVETEAGNKNTPGCFPLVPSQLQSLYKCLIIGAASHGIQDLLTPLCSTPVTSLDPGVLLKSFTSRWSSAKNQSSHLGIYSSVEYTNFLWSFLAGEALMKLPSTLETPVGAGPMPRYVQSLAHCGLAAIGEVFLKHKLCSDGPP